MQSAIIDVKAVSTPASNSSTDEVQGTGELVLLMPEVNVRKPAGHGCKNRQLSSKSDHSSSSVRSSAGCRSVIQCTVCSKTFNNSSALAKHKLIHSEERRYICSQCSKSFKRQDHLNGHIMIHSSKKPYECKYVGCDKSYCDARSLKRHLENHHQQLVDSCSSANSEGVLTPRSATDLPSAGQSTVFSFDFTNSPTVAGQNIAADNGSTTGLTHSQSSPTISASSSGVNQPPSGMIWIGGVNPLDEPLPVQCSVCDRRFRNLPALNGHMRLHGGYVKKDEVDEVTNQLETEAQFSVSSSLAAKPSSVEKLLCSTGNGMSSDSSVCSFSESVLSKDSMLAHVRVQNSVTGDSSENNDWFSYKPVTNDNVSAVHDGLDMVDIEDCPSAFDVESVCNTIDFDAIIDLGLNTTDVMSGIRCRDNGQVSLVGQPEMISGQSCFTDSTNQSADSAAGNNLVCCVDDIQDKDGLNTTVGLCSQLVCADAVSMKTVVVQPTSLLTDVPSCVPSDVPEASSAKCELATSFLTPKTPTNSQGFPPYATHFSFSSPDVLQSSPVSVPRPKTPVVNMSLPASAHPQLSPQAPYTPDTPSVFQFPSPNQSPASSSGCSPAARHSKRRTASFHPYSSPSATTSSPRYMNQQQASVQQREQQKRLEMEVAEAHSEIDQYIRRLQQADLQQRQQSQMQDMCSPEMSSKLSVTVPAETGMLSDTGNGNTPAVCGQAVSPIEEVIQILVAEHFGVTVPVPSKFLQDDLRRTSSDPKLHIKLTDLQVTADGTEHPVTEEYCNPGTVPSSKPRKQKPEPLVIPASVSNFGLRSQLRSPKLSESGCAARQFLTTTALPYTPPPMISPAARTGSRVFWKMHGARHIPAGPLSAPPCHISFMSLPDANRASCESSMPSLTDIDPHVNIGPQYQADLASVTGEGYLDAANSGTLLWDPKVVENLTDEELKSYQNFACSANIPGNRGNHEYALHLLQTCNGHIKAAQKKLLQRERCSSFSQHDEWSQQEMETFGRCLIATNKDFSVVAKQVGTKSVKQCVEFYYIWKKVCEDEYQLLCQSRKQHLDLLLNSLCSSTDGSDTKNRDPMSDVV